MESQRFFWGYIPGLIDPTCQRYCFKAFLKYWYEKAYGEKHVLQIELTTCLSKLKINHWIRWSIECDYQQRCEILLKSYNRNHLSSKSMWAFFIQQNGPIIVSGYGIGSANRFINHAILIIGMDTNSEDKAFIYLDPLVGPEIQRAPWSMNNKFSYPIIYAKPKIIQTLRHNSEKYFTVTKFAN